MSGEAPFTIEQFYRFVSEKKLMGAKCNECGKILLPPRPICPKCLSRNLSWVQLKNRGKLLTYTIIHVAPERFQSMAPYALGIIELEEGVRLLGVIQGVRHEDLRVGMSLEVDFDTNVPASPAWPPWPRYFFKLRRE